MRRTRGERKFVTMLFADLAGYTALAEQLDPEEVYGFLRPTMAELQGIVESYGGTVPQLLGDGFMAVFGVPVTHEDDAERAVRAALEVRDRVGVLNAGRTGRIQVPAVHSGVNSGVVMVAPSDEAAGFRVVGDTVNTASRLAGLAPPGRILVDETTRKRAHDGIRYGPRRLRKAKGKAEPLVTFEALAVDDRRGPKSGRAFVDRVEMLATLGRELAQVERDGLARVLVMTGEPGVGKSRLAAELGKSLPPGRFLHGRCVSFGARPLLSALAEAVSGALGLAPGMAPSVVRTAIDQAARSIGSERLAPALATDLRALLTVQDDVPRGERDVARAARLVLEQRARTGPVLVVLDDLHWADPSLVELLVDVHHNPWPAPVLFLGLSRARIPQLPAAPLEGLDPSAMRSLVESLLGGASSAELLHVPVSRANGNPLFLEEMVEMLVESGAIRERAGSWQVVDPDLADDVPEAIRLLIAARLDALPAAEKELLQDAAVCGPVTWDALLSNLSDAPDQPGGLRVLVARGLLRRNRTSTFSGTDEYEWKHALIRDVAYDTLPRLFRAQRHAQVGDWLRSTARGGREPVALIAYHYELAWELAVSVTGPGPDAPVTVLAADYLTRWAEQTFIRQARGAEPLFRGALRVVESSGHVVDARTRARAHLGLAETLAEMGAHAEAAEHATRARHLADRAGLDQLAARAMLVLGRCENDRGSYRRARSLLRKARQRFEDIGDLRGQGWALHRLSETWDWADQARELDDLRSAYQLFARARDRFGRGVVAGDLAYLLSVEGGAEFHRWYELARRLIEGDGDLRSRAALLRTWAHYCYSAGRFTEAITTAQLCRPLAEDSGDRYTEADSLLLCSLAGVHAGDPAVAISLAREAAQIGAELGSIRIPTLARLATARAEARAGRPAAAMRVLRQARATVERHEVRVMHADLAQTEAMLILDRGQWDKAGAAAEALQVALRDVPMRLWKPLPLMVRGRGLLGAGAAKDAGAVLAEAVVAARAARADGALALATACASQAALLAGLKAPRTPARATPSEPEVAAVSAENAGLRALLCDDPRTAVASFDSAVARWEQLGSTSWLARALSMRATALRATGERTLAALSLARARTTMDDVGMPARSRASVERPVESQI